MYLIQISEIKNKGLTPEAQALDPGQGFQFYFSTIWMLATTFAGLALVMYLIYGGVAWMTAGGDKQKLEKARSIMTDALMGLVIVVAVWAIVAYVLPVLGLDILTGIDWSSLAP